MGTTFVRTFVFVSVLVLIITQVSSTKISYKKPIYGKSQMLRKDYYKIKPEMLKTTTTESIITTNFETGNSSAQSPESVSTFEEVNGSTFIPTTTSTPTNSTQKIGDVDEAQKRHTQVITPNRRSIEEQADALENPDAHETKIVLVKNISDNSSEMVEVELKLNDLKENFENMKTIATFLTTRSPSIDLTKADGIVSSTTRTTTTKPNESNVPVPCTCGVFMTSQIKRGISKSEPVIVNELDRTFPCNAIGQKQCQTKCLETIVQHLPHSANILCASLDRDCRKERAYLFIKNCRNIWWNTHLAAGREYCCKSGKPYPCPLV